MLRSRSRLLLVPLFALVACHDDSGGGGSNAPVTKAASKYPADVASQWFAVLHAAVKAEASIRRSPRAASATAA
jgi:hypothetical protein